MERYKNYFIVILAINFCIIAFSICSFQSIKKISDDGDYFVILNNGLYIYNFEKSKCEAIMKIGNSIFKSKDEENSIIITKNINSDLNEIKIASLINQYLYVCKINNTTNNCDYNDIKSLSDTFPFNVQIDNAKLNIYLLKYELGFPMYKYFIKSFHFNNYSIIKNGEPKISVCEENYSNKPNCQFDKYNSLIKCVYLYWINNRLKYQSISTAFNLISSFYIEDEKNYDSLSLTFSENIDFVCGLQSNLIGCFYKKKSEEKFIKITHNFENGCSNLQTYYFDENNEFILSCKKSSNYYLYIFDANYVMNNIKQQVISLPYYNKKISFIYENKINRYDFIYDDNFTKSCGDYNEEEDEPPIDMTNKISYKYIYDTIKTQDSKENKPIPIPIDLIYKRTDFPEKIENFTIKEDSKYNMENILQIIEIKTNKTKEEIMSNINQIIAENEIGNDLEIKGKDCKVTINPTNSTAFQNSTHVDFQECEQILREEYNISNSSTILFIQEEIENKDPKALYNQIQYHAYSAQKGFLDLSLCEDIETQIHYKLKDDINLDFEKIKKFKEKGVDIFNINDKFFNDICRPYSESNNDMILDERVNYIYQNYTLCEEGCTFNNIDVDSRMLTCNCKIRGNFSNITIPLVYDTSNISFFDSNIAIAKCYNLVFSFSNKANNIGFIIFTILLIIYIIFFIIFLRKGIKPISSFVFNEMIKYGYLKLDNSKVSESTINKDKDKSTILAKNIKKENKSNPTKKSKTKRKIKHQKTKIINLVTSEVEKNNNGIIKEKGNKNPILFNFNFNNGERNKNKSLTNKKVNPKNNHKIKEEIDNFGIIKINLNKNIKKYYPKDSDQTLFNYTFEETIKFERRNIFRIFYIYLLNKQIIFHTFLLRSPLELFVLRFMLFIFMLSCDLAMNSLFYSNDNISKKYHYAKNLFLFAFSNNLTIIIYSTLASYAIITLMTKLTHSSNSIRNIFRKEEEKIKSKKNYKINEKRKEEIYKEVLKVFKYLKIKLIFFFVIEIILILFFWYFVTVFCEVYSKTQTSWLLDGFLSILSRFFIELIAAFLYAKLYQISVASNMETLFKIVMCLYDFS